MARSAGASGYLTIHLLFFSAERIARAMGMVASLGLDHAVGLSRGRPLALARWLFAVAVMVAAIVVVGGITRLTESGVSITECCVAGRIRQVSRNPAVHPDQRSGGDDPRHL